VRLPASLPVSSLSRGKARKCIQEPDAEKDQKFGNEDTEGGIKKKLNNMFRSLNKLNTDFLK
jgi:hypothetical protein